MYGPLPAEYYCLNMFNPEYLVQWKSIQQVLKNYLKVNSMTEKLNILTVYFEIILDVRVATVVKRFLIFLSLRSPYIHMLHNRSKIIKIRN